MLIYFKYLNKDLIMKNSQETLKKILLADKVLFILLINRLLEEFGKIIN